MSDFTAIQWDGTNVQEILELIGEMPIYFEGFTNRDDIVGIKTVDGIRAAKIGDFVMKREDGLHVLTEQECGELLLKTTEEVERQEEGTP